MVVMITLCIPNLPVSMVMIIRRERFNGLMILAISDNALIL